MVQTADGEKAPGREQDGLVGTLQVAKASGASTADDPAAMSLGTEAPLATATAAAPYESSLPRNFFWICLIVYLYSLGTILWKMFVPPNCGHGQCIKPMFEASELASADLWFFTTEDPLIGEWTFRFNRPPAHIAADASRVYEHHRAAQKERVHNEKEVASATLALHPGEVEQEGEGESPDAGEINGSIKFVTVARGIDLSGGLGAWEDTMRVPIFPSTRGNRTLYGLFFLCPGSRPLAPTEYPVELAAVVNGVLIGAGRKRTFDESVLFTATPLTAHSIRRTSASSMLLEKPTTDVELGTADGKKEERIANCWRYSYHPLRLRLVAPVQEFPHRTLEVDNLVVNLHQTGSAYLPSSERKGSGRTGPLLHRPWFYVDDWTVLNRQLVELSPRLDYPDPPAKLQIKSAQLGRMRIFNMLSMVMNQFVETGMFSSGDLDEIKRYLSDEWMWRFALMQFISLAHAILSYLAFKNDVGFWKGKESVAGISSRSVIFNAFASTVIFLYLMDYNTSFVVLATSGYGAYIDIWKVTRVLKISWSFSGGMSWGEQTAAEKETAALDATALDAVGLGVGPLVVGFALHSLVTQPHRSFYSWMIESLANAIYLFGFVFMTPQLFINYKLKSVAHMPWRVMGYKFFNTIIDDVFSFLVDMPTSHRLACFRDDVVFLIFLYQRYLYPVDKRRANEFGVAYEDDLPVIEPVAFSSAAAMAAKGIHTIEYRAPATLAQGQGNSVYSMSHHQHTVEFVSQKSERRPGDGLASVADAIELLKNPSFAASFRVAIEAGEASASRDVLDVVRTRPAEYRASYRFPPVGEGSPVSAQDLIDRIFDTSKHAGGEAVLFFRLADLTLAPHKLEKSPHNHRAELYIWQGAHDLPVPRHQPFWLDESFTVTEGSSTFISVLKHFPPHEHPKLKVPCIVKPGFT